MWGRRRGLEAGAGLEVGSDASCPLLELSPPWAFRTATEADHLGPQCLGEPEELLSLAP